MTRQPFSITTEDALKANEKWDGHHCPFCQAVRRQFPKLKFKRVSLSQVINHKGEVVAVITKSFLYSNFEDLVYGDIEFETEIILK